MEANKYIVVKIVDDSDVIGITERENFKTVSLGDCHNKYGIKIGELYEESYEEEVEAWTYFDGSNFMSFFLSSDVGIADVEEVYEELENSILSELPDKPSSNMYEEGIARIETENYIFKFSQFTSDPFMCRVEYK